MDIKLFIAENRPAFFQIWADAFRGVGSVLVLNEQVSLSRTTTKVDAEIMRGIFAHERYGGMFKVGRSQILSTKGDPQMPPWVATTPPFSGHLETRVQPDGTLRATVVPDKIRLPEEEEYIAFSEVFDEVERFNSGHHEPKITSLSFSPEFLGIPRHDIHSEIGAIKKAYLDHRS